MEYCLIEKWCNHFTLPNNSRALAISPNACYELDLAGVEYDIFDDFYNKNDISNNDYDHYLKDQLLWFKEFDELIKDIYIEASSLDVNLASLFYYNIKYLADHLISNSITLNNFLDEKRPSKIWYIEDVNENDKFDQWSWFTYGKNSYLLLVELLCNKRNIECEKLTDIESKSFNSQIKKNKSGAFYNVSKFKLLINNYTPRLFQLLKHLKIRYTFWKKIKSSYINNKIKRKIFIINIHDYSSGFISDASQNSYLISYLLNNYAINASTIRRKKKISFISNDDINNNNNNRISNLLNSFKNNSLMQWINIKCTVDVSDILILRFEYLFKKIFPSTLGLIKGFINHYNSNDIDYVFTNSLATIYDYAAVAAARLSRKTKSIGFFHGIDVVANKERFFMEYNNFDIYFTSTSFELENIENLKSEFNSRHPLLGTFPYYRDHYFKKSIFYSNRNDIERKNTILFLPIVRKRRNSAAHTRKHLTTMSSIRWHKALLKYFSGRTDLNFIWKDPFYNNNYDDSVFKTINNKNYKNINYENCKLEKVLPLVSRVICDIPSTGFFESIIAGYPVITFSEIDNNNIQENAYSFLGNSLKSFSTIDDKLSIIENFLNDSPEKYFVNLPKDESSVIEVLNSNII